MLRTLEFERNPREYNFLACGSFEYQFYKCNHFQRNVWKKYSHILSFFSILRIELDLKVKHESFSRMIIFKIVIVERSVSI